MVATGNYVNVYDDSYDVFVILNEPNDPPGVDDVDVIEKVVNKVFLEHPEDYKSKGMISSRISEALDKLNFECMKYGYQILIKRYDQNESGLLSV